MATGISRFGALIGALVMTLIATYAFALPFARPPYIYETTIIIVDYPPPDYFCPAKRPPLPDFLTPTMQNGWLQYAYRKPRQEPATLCD